MPIFLCFIWLERSCQSPQFIASPSWDWIFLDLLSLHFPTLFAAILSRRILPLGRLVLLYSIVIPPYVLICPFHRSLHSFLHTFHYEFSSLLVSFLRRLYTLTSDIEWNVFDSFFPVLHICIQYPSYVQCYIVYHTICLSRKMRIPLYTQILITQLSRQVTFTTTVKPDVSARLDGGIAAPLCGLLQQQGCATRQ